MLAMLNKCPVNLNKILLDEDVLLHNLHFVARLVEAHVGMGCQHPNEKKLSNKGYFHFHKRKLGPSRFRNTPYFEVFFYACF